MTLYTLKLPSLGLKKINLHQKRTRPYGYVYVLTLKTQLYYRRFISLGYNYYVNYVHHHVRITIHETKNGTNDINFDLRFFAHIL